MGTGTLEHVTRALEGLCPQTGCCNNKRKTINKKDCEQQARQVAYAVVDAVNDLLKDQINKYGVWPTGGWVGNLSESCGGPGIKCNTWAPVIKRNVNIMVRDKYYIKDNDRLFQIKTNEYYNKNIPCELDSHNWSVIYGPCNDEDFVIIDPWTDAGRTIIKGSQKPVTNSY